MYANNANTEAGLLTEHHCMIQLHQLHLQQRLFLSTRRIQKHYVLLNLICKCSYTSCTPNKEHMHKLNHLNFD